MTRRLVIFSFLAAVVFPAGIADVSAGEPTIQREEPFTTRPMSFARGERWIGNAIAYGPYRDGQAPGETVPARAQLREDLTLLAQHWQLLRTYGAREATPAILEVIQEDGLDVRVVIGVWIVPETRVDTDGATLDLAQQRAANRSEIESAVRLAGKYPEIVAAVCVGSETQVSWSNHRCPPELLIEYIQEIRSRVRVPVSTADDFSFWSRPASVAVSREIDFLMVHLHPLWNGVQVDDALGWVERNLEDVRRVHPGHPLVVGETGWATTMHPAGEQARLIRGIPGEGQQKVFHDGIRAWGERSRVPVFFFEAFDENWKGGSHPDDVEKHWGLFRADRSPKKAMAGLEGSGS